MARLFLAILTIPLLLTLASNLVKADVICRLKETEFSDGTSQATTSTLYMSEKNVRYESGTGEDDADIIFRGDRDVLWHLNHGDKSYKEMDRKTIAEFGAKLREAMAAMNEQMASLPPEQRKAMEDAMKGQGAGTSQSGKKETKDELKKSGEKKTISDFSCIRYDYFVDGKKSSEIWVAEPGQRGVSESDLAPVKEMAEFFSEFASAMGEALGQEEDDYGWEAWTHQGFPILTREFVDGEVHSEVLVESIAKEKIDPARFEVPAGYKRRTMDE